MYDEEKMKKKVKGKKTPVVEINVTKRVNFPWLNNKTACRAKAFMAYKGDRQIKRMHSMGNRKKFFDMHILPKVLRKFPRLYDLVTKYYHEKGKPLTQEHFEELLRARFMNMYDSDLSKSPEHPVNSSHAGIKKAYTKCTSRS